MRIAPLAFCLAGFSIVAQAQAGHGLFKHRSIPVAPYSSSSSVASTGCPACDAAAAAGSSAGMAGSSYDGQQNPPTRPYSYYAARDGKPRGYYGYGEDQFPYYGRAYGHPYDPWTWPYMTDGYQNSLNRYYAPPVR